MKGKIICINKYIHRVLLENNTIIDTRTRGKLRNQKVSPVVGDNVIVDINNIGSLKIIIKNILCSLIFFACYSHNY